MLTYLSDKMPPKKVKIKKRKKWDLANLEKYFNFNFFWGHFVTKTSLLFQNQFKILDFLIPYMTYFKEKNFHLSEEPILKFINTKVEKR